MSNAADDGRPGEPSGFALESFLPYRLSVLTNTVSRTLARHYERPFDIGVLEWRVIAVVGRFEPVTAGQVGERTAMDKVAVSRAVTSLLGRGLLLRRTDPVDRRRALLRLSSRGRVMHDRIAERAARLEQALCDALSGPERAELARLLDKLSERAAQLDRFGVPSAEERHPDRDAT